jgi:hypothetical protein
MEDHTKVDKNLEIDGLVHRVDSDSQSTTILLDEETGNYMQSDEDDDAKAGDTMEKPNQHWATASILQPRKYANISFYYHECLLILGDG